MIDTNRIARTVWRCLDSMVNRGLFSCPLQNKQLPGFARTDSRLSWLP